MAQATMVRAFLDTVKAHGLTQHQFATLALLSSNPGIGQTELAAYLDTDRASMLAVVGRLQSRSLLARQQSGSDRRRQELYLTSAGEQLLLEARPLVEAHDARYAALFSKAEFALLSEWLERIYAV
jgi:DNA-binding MarR family transcriptional regulator